MATFQARIEGLTGLSITDSSKPTLTSLTEFIKDGVFDVTHRWLSVKSQDRSQFTAVTAEQSSNGANLNGAKIISVVREAGTDNDWRECRKIPVGLQARVTDVNSLQFASKYHPVWMEDEDGKINVFPTPSSNPDTYKIYYINNAPTDSSGSSLTYADSNVASFPDDKVYLVVMYAGLKCLQAVMAAMHDDSNINAAFANFRSNMSSGINQFDIGKEAVSDYSDNLFNGLNFEQSRGRFKDVKKALEQANDLINGSLPATGYNAFAYFLREDPEMVTASLGLVDQQLKIATTAIQEFSINSDLFSKELQAYMTAGTTYIQGAASYLTEIQAYVGLFNQEYTWYNARYQELKAEYDGAFAIARPQQAPQRGA